MKTEELLREIEDNVGKRALRAKTCRKSSP